MRSPLVFISYAREDRDAARRLYADLRSVGVEPWLDEESLLPGQKWQSEIRKAIKKSEYFIAILSKNSVGKRGYVQRELNEALRVFEEVPESDVYAIPIRLDECEVSNERLQELHRVDMFPSWRGGLAKILLALGRTPKESVARRSADLPVFRIATFNLGNFGSFFDQNHASGRVADLKSSLMRLNADVICFQEWNATELGDGSRALTDFEEVVSGTPYSDYHCITTKTSSGDLYYERNLVVVSKFDIARSWQIRNSIVSPPSYTRSFSVPPERMPMKVSWERPVVCVELKLSQTQSLYVINVHLKSQLPSAIPGQQTGRYTWMSASGWAEGSFVSLIRRSGQALEVRGVVDQLLTSDSRAMIAVCGDFNADVGEVALDVITGGSLIQDDLLTKKLVTTQAGIPEGSRFTILHHGQPRMIDHILVSKALLEHYRYSEIHNEYLQDQSITEIATIAPLSDHAPLVAEFILETP